MSTMTAVPQSTPGAETRELRELRNTICDRIAVDLRRDGSLPKDDATRAEVHRRVNDFLSSARADLDPAARENIMRSVNDELFGLGPIQPLLDDPTVTEIM